MTKTDGPDQSPDFLGGAPRRGAGVRRLNKVPIVIAVGLALVVVGAVGYTYQQRLAAQRHGVVSDSAPRDAQAGKAVVLFSNAPANGIIPAAHGAPPAAFDRPASMPSDGSAPSDRSSASNLNAQMWQQYRQRQDQADQARAQAEQSALSAATTVGNKGANTQAPAQPSNQLAGLNASAQGGLSGLTPGGQMGMGAGATDDPNGQTAKKAFMAMQSGQADDYLKATRNDPLSAYEVKGGTAIPAIMVSGINSDLPGMIIGQVSENVYDTATGQFLLIPQGAKLIGTYDNGVTMGQSRALVAWNRIIFPDASSLNLAGMPGADQGGYAGFNDQTNNHYSRIFTTAILLSVFSAGVQLSQPQAVNGQNYSSAQTIAGAMGQQLGQLGSESARRNMQIQPTLEIRPGYRFNVMVTKDMVIRPWGHPATQTEGAAS